MGTIPAIGQFWAKLSIRSQLQFPEYPPFAVLNCRFDSIPATNPGGNLDDIAMEP
jgi:hypothetical protein